ncbi:MAG: LysR family transcriptional regulator [Dactylosporangium sp.]|nr:LysR family transcriptional regulator [Dactylosporangium sp.]NNJ60683.1 LysR family transcriptional regulator [Dactylosporangium sp.]
MDLMSLKYFQFVAMYRNFSKAAQHFYIGQSALSRQIAKLEKELDVQLFHRDTRNVSLTDAGRVLYDNCDLLLRHHDLINRLMAAVKGGHSGHLSIATVANFGSTITDLVKLFMATYPMVNTRVDDIPFDQLSDSIIHGVYDLAFTLDFAVPHNDQLARVPVGEDRFVAVMCQEYPHDFGGVISTRELLTQPLIVPRHIDPPFLRQLRLAGQERDIPAAAGIEYVPNTNTAMLQIDLGLGITFLPKSIADGAYGAQQYRCCELGDLDTRFQTLLIRRRDNTQQTMENFVGLVRTERGGRRAPR